MEFIIIIAYIGLVICGAFCLFHSLQFFEFNNRHIEKILYFIGKFYDSVNLQAAVVIVSYFTVYYFLEEDADWLFIAGILVLVSCAITALKIHFVPKVPPSVPSSPGIQCAALAYIETYNEIEKYKKALLAGVSTGVLRFQTQANESEAVLLRLGHAVTDYIADQHKDVKTLLKSRNDLECAFDSLKSTTSEFENLFKGLLKKLRASVVTLEHFDDNTAALIDMKDSVHDLYFQNNADVSRQVQDLIDRLNWTVKKMGEYQSYPKAYRDSITLLTQKVENALQSIETTSRNKKETLTKLCTDLAQTVAAQNKNLTGLEKASAAYVARNGFVLARMVESFEVPPPPRKQESSLRENSSLSTPHMQPTIRWHKYCDMCGAKIEEGQDTCPSCGESVVIAEDQE